jgi:hypothetical protein
VDYLRSMNQAMTLIAENRTPVLDAAAPSLDSVFLLAGLLRLPL